MKTMRLWAFLTVISAMHTTLIASQVLWSIGKTDASGREFAAFGDYKGFWGKPDQEGIKPFVVGRDEASALPYILPGPSDQWAGAKSRPVKLEFDLTELPQNECELVLDLVGSHAHALKVQAVLNGTPMTTLITGGAGDPLLENEKAAPPKSFRIAFHPSLLKSGRNELQISTIEGSWLLFDALKMEATDRKAQLLKQTGVEPRPFLKKRGEGMVQLVQLKIQNYGRETDVVLKSETPPFEENRKLVFGENRVDLLLPRVDKPTTIPLVVSVNETVFKEDFAMHPVREWKIFAVPSIHTDIGYTDTQENVYKRHNANLDEVVKLCRDNPLFKWNIEVAWEMQNYFNQRSTTESQALIDLMKQQRVGLHGAYLNMLTALMSDEAMNRYIYYAHELRQKYGVRAESAVLTDVPSATWSVPSTLAASGVKFFAEGCNQTRGPILRRSGIRDPFYWEGPDGARVLTWLAESYAQSIWMRSRKIGDWEEQVTHVVNRYNRDDFPYDAIYLYGAAWDNEALGQDYGAILHEYTAKWDYPKIMLSMAEDFCEHIEKNFKDKVPVRRGDFGAYWEDGAGSTSHETTMHVNSQRRITAAETLFSLALLNGADTKYPQDRFRTSWENLLFYAEHTWGAAQSIADPEHEMTKVQWAGKAEFAHKPDAETRKLLDEGLKAYASTVAGKAGEIIVANTLSWPRGGVVELPTPVNGSLVDDAGKNIPLQKAEGKVLAYVGEVPALGSRILRQGGSQETASPAQEEAGVLSNAYYRISYSDQGVTGIRDVQSGRELIDTNSPYGFGQIVYAAGANNTKLTQDDIPTSPVVVLNDGTTTDPLNPPTPQLLFTRAEVKRVKTAQPGPLFSELVIHASAPSMQDIKTTLRLYNHEKRIGVDVRITAKKEIRGKEAVYVAFPFAGKKPQFRLGMTNAVARPDKDFAPGACREWYCVQDFVACATDAIGEVVMTSLDAPLFCLSDMNRGLWPSEPDLTTATVFSYAMNNYWFTNYKAGQGGDFLFRYELTSADKPMPNEHCVKFARDSGVPLYATAGVGGEAKPAASPLQVKGEGVVVTTVKQSEDGSAIIARIRNASEKPTTANVTSGLRTSVADLVETDKQAQEPKPGPYSIAIPPQGTVTLRLSK